MYTQRTKTPKTLPIRQISPKTMKSNMQAPPFTPENWKHLVSIVMTLVQDKKIKDSAVADLITRLRSMESTIDNGTTSDLKCSNYLAPISETFTFKSVPAFLRARLRRSYALISSQGSQRATRHSSYRLTFHQYIGVPGIGIGVSIGINDYGPSVFEEILFLEPHTLDTLVESVAGEKERKLPDLLLKYLRVEKKEFVQDWMRGYINLENDEDEYWFSVDRQTCADKDIWIEYLGTFDSNGSILGENRIGSYGKCGKRVVDATSHRIDVMT